MVFKAETRYPDRRVCGRKSGRNRTRRGKVGPRTDRRRPQVPRVRRGRFSLDVPSWLDAKGVEVGGRVSKSHGFQTLHGVGVPRPYSRDGTHACVVRSNTDEDPNRGWDESLVLSVTITLLRSVVVVCEDSDPPVSFEGPGDSHVPTDSDTNLSRRRRVGPSRTVRLSLPHSEDEQGPRVTETSSTSGPVLGTSDPTPEVQERPGSGHKPRPRCSNSRGATGVGSPRRVPRGSGPNTGTDPPCGDLHLTPGTRVGSPHSPSHQCDYVPSGVPVRDHVGVCLGGGLHFLGRRRRLTLTTDVVTGPRASSGRG